jgi:hypothetical protein
MALKQRKARQNNQRSACDTEAVVRRYKSNGALGSIFVFRLLGEIRPGRDCHQFSVNYWSALKSGHSEVAIDAQPQPTNANDFSFAPIVRIGACTKIVAFTSYVNTLLFENTVTDFAPRDNATYKLLAFIAPASRINAWSASSPFRSNVEPIALVGIRRSP